MKFKNFIRGLSSIFSLYPIQREILRIDYLNPLKIVKEDDLYHITDGSYYLSLNMLLLCDMSWVEIDGISQCVYSDSKGDYTLYGTTSYKEAKNTLESLEYREISSKSWKNDNRLY